MKIYRQFIYGTNCIIIDGEWRTYTVSEPEKPFFNIELPGELVRVTRFIVKGPKCLYDYQKKETS